MGNSNKTNPMIDQEGVSVSSEDDFDEIEFLTSVQRNQTSTIRQRLEAQRLLERARDRQSSEGVTLNRLSRADLEALAVQVAHERGLKPMALKG